MGYFNSELAIFKKIKRNIVNHIHVKNGASRSLHPLKKELKGILIPCHEEFGGNLFRFKLGTQKDEYLLSMSNKNLIVAQRAGWDEVIVRGRLDTTSKVIEVEKIIIATSDDSFSSSPDTSDINLDIDVLQRTISAGCAIQTGFEPQAS